MQVYDTTLAVIDMVDKITTAIDSSQYSITGSAVALHCVKAHRQSQWRSPNFNPL